MRSGPDLPPSYPSYHDSSIPLPPCAPDDARRAPHKREYDRATDRVWIAHGWSLVEHRRARAGLAVLARLEAFGAAELSLGRVLPRIVALKDRANACMAHILQLTARGEGEREGGVSKGGLSAMSTSAEFRIGATPAGYTRDPPGVSSLGVFTFSATRDSAACQACPEHPLFQRVSLLL